MSLMGKVLHMVIELQARNKSLNQLTRVLSQSGDRVASRLAGAANTPTNRELAAHLIGIERWGQRRLRVLLGEPLVIDEYDGYRPADSKGIPALVSTFRTTRADTLGLVTRLQSARVAPTATVPHNDMGDLTVRGWLSYLETHAAREASRLKK
jgi:hypothetical protein